MDNDTAPAAFVRLFSRTMPLVEIMRLDITEWHLVRMD